MLTETHGERTIMTMGAESIVKNTVLEGHAHGDTPRRSDNEPDGGWTWPPEQGHTVGKQ